MISIIIPLYNKEKYIARTLNSVLKQTFKDFEIVIVNDGSNDKSIEIIETFTDNRIKLISQKNSGVSSARNKGIKESKYDLIAFLDADDEWNENYLDKINDLISKYPKCIAFSTSYIISNNNSLVYNETKGLIDKDLIFEDYFDIASKNAPPFYTSSIVVRKKSLQQIGMFPVGVTAGEDLITWARLALIGNIAYSKEHLSTYNNNTTIWEVRRVDFDKNRYMEKSFRELLKTSNNKNSLKKYVSLWHKMRAHTFLLSGQKKYCFEESFLSLKYNLLNFKIYIIILLNIIPNKFLIYILKFAK